MNLDEYRDRMAAAHQAFTTEVTAMLAAYGRTQTVFTDTLRSIDQHFTDMEESVEELKRLIMEQGADLRAQRDELRELRARLNGRDA